MLLRDGLTIVQESAINVGGGGAKGTLFTNAKNIFEGVRVGIVPDGGGRNGG
jgi:hypothetical protein